MPALLWLLLGSLGPGCPHFGVVAASAQDIGARAYLNPRAVGVDRTFVLNVEVVGSQSVDSEPGLPDISAFAAYLGSGTSTSMQIVNGRTTVSFTIQYRYLALKEGTFDIPSFTVTVGGQRYSTEPLSLTVSATPPPDPRPRTPDRSSRGGIPRRWPPRTSS